MATISVRYAALTSGTQGLEATWARIEGHLAELETVVGGTSDMSSQALSAYLALKARWTAAAVDRQQTLRMLAEVLRRAGEHYRQVDATLAAQFT